MFDRIESALSSARLSVLFAFVVTMIGVQHAAGQTLRMANWNMGNLPNSTIDQANLGTIFNHIGTIGGPVSARPFDLLAMAETDTSSAADAMNVATAAYGQTYASILSSADGGSDRTGFLYNTSTLSLLASQEVAGGLTHRILRGQFRPVGTTGDADFYFYSVHLKSGATVADRNLRVAEAQLLRADADALGEANVVFGGDFNWSGVDENGADPALSAWDVFAAAGAGRVTDPVNALGEWRDNAAFLSFHTNAPNGAMDDRFDMQLISDELNDAVGLDYLSGSYRVVGNNGTHLLNENITTGTGAPVDVLAALAGFSDHLPVFADYTYIVPEPAGAAFIALTLACVRRQRAVQS